ncbi:hypothetical protein H1P_20061 [Hyella patelloides LEGE 07179]|uniref:Uncharacterized protein n=1 Tax=Hyella patelloides LEGE 07179 TaxID=945734 RepID=A0A563VPX8_9CYAN|nr:hypothetical protein H1P_20061 [Hyella patelloides LEGE 07179]
MTSEPAEVSSAKERASPLACSLLPLAYLHARNLFCAGT